MIAYDYVFFDFINDSTSLVVGTPARPPIFVAQSAAAAEANVAAWRAGTGPRRIFCRRRKRRRDHVVQTAVRPIVIIIGPPAIRNISQLVNMQK